EAGQRGAFVGGVEAGVEGNRGNVPVLEFLGDALGLGARATIDDAALAFVAGQDFEQLGNLADFRGGGDRQVGAVEAGDEHVRVRHRQAAQDVGARARVGGGGQRDAGDAGEVVGE